VGHTQRRKAAIFIFILFIFCVENCIVLLNLPLENSLSLICGSMEEDQRTNLKLFLADQRVLNIPTLQQ
jgi:hypothetical protein